RSWKPSGGWSNWKKPSSEAAFRQAPMIAPPPAPPPSLLAPHTIAGWQDNRREQAAMAQNNTITFYDLALSTGATISPFVWATKYAVKHKGFDLDVVPGGFTGIPER